LTEHIVISVPKTWDDAKKDDLKKRLDDIYLPADYVIMITNTLDVKIIDTDTMDKLREKGL